jgi:hypothetical protein
MRRAEDEGDLGAAQNDLFFTRQLDRANQIDLACEFGF